MVYTLNWISWFALNLPNRRRLLSKRSTRFKRSSTGGTRWGSYANEMIRSSYPALRVFGNASQLRWAWVLARDSLLAQLLSPTRTLRCSQDLRGSIISGHLDSASQRFLRCRSAWSSCWFAYINRSIQSLFISSNQKDPPGHLKGNMKISWWLTSHQDQGTARSEWIDSEVSARSFLVLVLNCSSAVPSCVSFL